MVVNDSFCEIHLSNNTIPIPHVFNGIPGTIALNLIAWPVLILSFTVLRKLAWNYGRLSTRGDPATGAASIWSEIFYAPGQRDSCENTSTTPLVESAPTQPTAETTGYFAWIGETFKLTREQIRTRCGPDAVHYLSFQRHLLVVMTIITVISLAVILPVNMQGTEFDGFARGTITNLPAESELLWVHVCVAILYVPVVLVIMGSVSGKHVIKTAPTRTVMMSNISVCSKHAIRGHVMELVPNIHVENIELAYNTTKLTTVVDEYKKTIQAKCYCQHKRPELVLASTSLCGRRSVDGIELYSKRELELRREVSHLRKAALNKPVGIAFVTLSTPTEARSVVERFRANKDWTVNYAPHPSDIIWENLHASFNGWYGLKWTCVNLGMFLIMFFLTTPIYIVNLLNNWVFIENNQQPISDFLPTLILWTLTAIFPYAFAWSEKYLLSHRTRSKQNYSTMTKTFAFLLLTILILPSLGLDQASLLFRRLVYNYSDIFKYHMECIFMSGKGSFFVNYVITTALLGTALELLRFADCLEFVWKVCWARSRAEIPHIRNSIVLEFPFGMHYAWTLVLFIISTVYSVVCPIIMPFALLYIVLKHFGDRHNLYYAYGPINMVSKGGGRIHSTAAKLSEFSVVLLLIVLIAALFRTTFGINMKIAVPIWALIVTITIIGFRLIKIRYKAKRSHVEDANEVPLVYIADVMLVNCDDVVDQVIPLT